MSIAFDIAVSDLGSEATGALDELFRRRYGNRPIAEYAYGGPADWADVADGGWDLLGVPESEGGGGMGLRDLIAVATTCGRWMAPTPLLVSTMAKRWSPAARAQSGPVTLGVATESGRVLVPFGGMADIRFLADAPADVLGDAAPAGEDDFAPSLALTERAGPTVLAPAQSRELAIVWAAEAVGSAERALDRAVDYVGEREQFGQPVGRFQAVKHHLADALKLVQEAESATIWAAADAPLLRPALEIAFRSALRAAEISLHVHGGMGFTWELGLHVHLRQIVALRGLALPLGTVVDAR